MLFPTFTFAAFFTIVMVVGWMLHRKPIGWKLFMLAASYFFYGYWDWRFVPLIVASTVANQSLAWYVHRAPDERQKKIGVGAAIATNLIILGFFKYYGFFATSFLDTFGRWGLAPSPPLLEIILPVGISFFTFQAMSYVIDVRRKVIAPAAPLDFAVYLAFFPQLVAGPIVRASEFLPQLNARRNPRDIDLTRAMFLIGAGLFKKVVISSYVADAIVDDVFASPDRFSSLEILMAMYGYAVQIYADFSGYTDIAIGVALLLGFRFPDNFDRPYSAVSIQDFWRRWHMTLSRWLRDYLYISLGGNRGSASRRDRNLFLTMLLGGLWHGAAWTFVFWGAYQGVGLLVERRIMVDRPEPNPWIGRLITFHFICIGWVFFRAESIGRAGEILWRSLTAWGPAPVVTPLLVLVIVMAIGAQLTPRRGSANVQSDVSRLPLAVQGTAFGLFLVTVDLLGPEGVAPFIYFQF